ncbi:hypothetical protein CPB97_000713, partial [Podila verticillata]
KLRLSTSLPPLPYDPIESVEINAMGMDFTCPSCIYAPLATSSITAKTRLPFAKGAPIVMLKQEIDVLDENDERIGHLSTDFAAAISVGDKVSTSTPESPLKIYDDARAKRYSDFIGALNLADEYNLGLRGTADSILNLGDLGNITVKGIKLDVKTKLAGLQGLKDVKFVYGISFGSDVNAVITSVNLVNINNPSKLTLKIGDLALNTGLNTTKEGFGAISSISDLVLVPGSNYVASSTVIDSKTEVGKLLPNMLTGGSPVTLHLYPFSGSSKNPALDAGLQKLHQVLDLPPYLLGNMSAKAYAPDWHLEVPASAADDGIAYVTTTVGNPFYSADFEVINVDGRGFNPETDPSTLSVTGVGRLEPSVFRFIPPSPYLLKGGESKQMRFPLQFNPGNTENRSIQVWMDKAATSTSVKIAVVLLPLARVGKGGSGSIQYLASDFVYLPPPEVGGDAPLLDLHVGPDVVNLKKYFDKIVNGVVPSGSVSLTATPSTSPTTTISIPSVTPPPGTTNPVQTSLVPTPASPTPASPSPASPSPASPSPVGPNPVSPSPVAPSP